MSVPDEAGLRGEIVRVSRAMAERGLNRGTSGNVSARLADGMLVTPSGVVPDRLTPESIVRVAADGTPVAGALRPSSEWRMHLGLYARRSDVNAVVHCHSRHATILACAGRPIPPMHYMVMVGGKGFVPLAPYSTFGTDELARDVAEALDGGYACLMANHGQIAARRQPGKGAHHRRGDRGAGGGLLGNARHRRPAAAGPGPDGRGVRAVQRLRPEMRRG